MSHIDRQFNEPSIGNSSGVAISASKDRRVDHELRIGDLYDLACHLVLDERKVQRLLDSTLRAQDGGTTGIAVSWAEQRTLLVRRYLKHRRFFAGSETIAGSEGFGAGYLGRLTARVYSHGRASSTTASSFEVSLRKLRPEERVCLILRERLGLSVAEIAEITGFQCERVSIALFEAREKLRKFLPEEGDGWEQ